MPDKKRKRPSGPSGVSNIPRVTIRVPEERWKAFGEVCAKRKTDRSKAINEFIQREVDDAEEQ